MINQLLYDLDSFCMSETKICNVEECKIFLPSGKKNADSTYAKYLQYKPKYEWVSRIVTKP